MTFLPKLFDSLETSFPLALLIQYNKTWKFRTAIGLKAKSLHNKFQTDQLSGTSPIRSC